MSWLDERGEFALLVCCCRSNFAGSPQELPPTPKRADWDNFVRLAAFHRVEGLAWGALRAQSAALPESVRGPLAAAARSIAATNLAIARECALLRDSFGRADVPFLFVKGLTIAALVYRIPMLKRGWDIDLLVAPDALDTAARLLADRGFSVRIPDSIEKVRKWHAWTKESVWRSESGLHVELHTRLTENRRLIPSLGVRSPSQLIEVSPGIRLPTLGPDELFAYLCVHGASSAWFRLKWIADLAALLAGKPAAEIERLYRRSQELGAARSAGQALLLADALFATLGELPQLRSELRSDRSTRLLTAIALRQLAGRPDPVEPTEAPLGTAAIHYSQLLLSPGLGFKIGESARQVTAALRRLAF